MPAAESTSSPAAPADTVLITKKEVLQQLGWFCDQVQGKKHAGPTQAEATASENTKIDTYLSKKGVKKLKWEGQDRYMWHKDSPEYLHAVSVIKAYIGEHEDEIRMKADYIHWRFMLPEFGWSSKKDGKGRLSGPPGEECTNKTQKLYEKFKDAGLKHCELPKFRNEWAWHKDDNVLKKAKEIIKNHVAFYNDKDNKGNKVKKGFQIQVKTAQGTITIDDVNESDTIDSVITKLKAKGGGRGDMRYVAGSALEDGKKVSDYGIQKDSLIFEVPKGKGGMQGAGDLMPDIPLPQDNS